MGRKEEMAKRVHKIMQKPDQIRNIGIAAHIDHGKCVSPEAKVQLANGKPIKAKELYKQIEEEGENIKNQENTYKPKQEVKTISLNKETGKTEKAEIKYATKRKADKLIKITTTDGHEIKTTPEHKYLTLNKEGEMNFKEAKELKEEENIIGARKLPKTEELNPKRKLLKKLSENYKFYVKITEKLNSKITKTDKNLYKASKTKLKEKSLKHAAWRGQYRLRDIVNICKSLHIELKELYQNIEKLNYRGKDQRGVKSSLEIKPPEKLPSLFYLAGTFFGDGDLQGSITNNSTEIKEKIKKEAQQLGLETHIRKFEERGDRIEIGGKTLQKMLQEAFEYPKEDKSANIHIPDLVFQSAREEIAEFIKGYMDTDGTVEKNRSAVSISSKSQEMLEDLQLLLYQFDIASKLNLKNSTLYISGKLSLENYKEIGFTASEKQKKLKKLSEKSKSAKIDKVPIDGEKLKGIREKLEIPQSQVFQSYRNYETNQINLTKDTLQKTVQRFKELGNEESVPQMQEVSKLAKADTSFPKIESIQETKGEYVYDFGVSKHHNFVCEGLIIHNTTLSDNLIYGAGLMSGELAGKELAMDTMEQEQERGITIASANTSMVYEFKDDEYLINLIDTPGHVDFGGEVTRAMRAIDGAIVVVGAVEGIMPQTETVLRQALEEKVKPILYINKVDRLINELQIKENELQGRLTDIIKEVNKLIKEFAPNDELAKEWQVKVEDGSVAFGSALYNWGISLPYMKDTGIGFKDIYNYLKNDNQEELAEKSPVHPVILDMVVKHLPNPKESQEYRIPQIWGGDLESEEGKSMLECNRDGKPIMLVTNLTKDPHVGEVATARVYAGTVEEGQKLKLLNTKADATVQQVGIYMGSGRKQLKDIPAGNIAAITGLDDAFAGETVAPSEIEVFEGIEHHSEPVVTKSIEAKDPKKLPELIQALREVEKEDQTIEVETDEETGEHKISGMGELHLEVVEEMIREDKGVEVQTSKPIVVYRETVTEESQEVKPKTPNRHNQFVFHVEPVEEELAEGLAEGEIDTSVKSKKELAKQLREHGMDKKESKNIWSIQEDNIFIDMSKGVQYLNETQDLLVQAFEEAVNEGPLASEKLSRVKLVLTDASLHEDAVHRGPAQVIPTVKKGIKAAILTADPILLEPKKEIYIDTPQEYMGKITGDIGSRRGETLNMEQEGKTAEIKTKVPVAESFGFASDIRSLTQGKALWSQEYAGYEPLPKSLQQEIIKQVRERKGLKKQIPKPQELLS